MTFIAERTAWSFGQDGHPSRRGRVAPDDVRRGLEDETNRGARSGTPSPTRRLCSCAPRRPRRRGRRDVDSSVDITSVRAQRPNRQLRPRRIHAYRGGPRRRLDEGTSADDDVPASHAVPRELASRRSDAQGRARRQVSRRARARGAQVEWAGVFINDEDIDAAFADAEPPTHDDWQPGMVPERSRRRFVTIALQRDSRAESTRAFAPSLATFPR